MVGARVSIRVWSPGADHHAEQVPVTLVIIAMLVGVAVLPGLAQTTVILPDTSQTTGITVNIMEQATVTIPSTVLFTVANINTATSSTPVTVAVSNLTRKSTSTGVALSLRANTPAFVPPQAGAPTWSASDVSWAAGTWSGGSGTAGTLSSAAFTTVATCGTTGCSTNSLVLTLAAKPTVTRSGGHTLIVTWKIESLQ